MYLIVGLVVGGLICSYLVLKYFERRRRTKRFGSNPETELSGKHVVITGGSSGIGLAVACEAARRGASVSIIARSQERLDQAKKEIARHFVDNDKQKVVDCSADITARDTSILENELKNLTAVQGPIFMLVNCAGLSIPSRLETLTIDQVRNHS